MPIYEFYCSQCHMIFQFFSRRVNTEKRPRCPKCDREELERRISLVAVARKRDQQKEEGEGEGAMPDVDEARMMEAMESLSREAEGADTEDPRQMARWVRRLYEAAGMQAGAGMEEALRRLEGGEDPEAIEQELGDVLENEEELFTAGGAKGKLTGLRRALPPRTDQTLYDL